MAGAKKDSDNTPLEEIGTIPTEDSPAINPNTKTLIDRYVFAANWCKGKRVLDAACGHGYGSMILKSLGANTVYGQDIDEGALELARKKYSDKDLDFHYNDLTQEPNERGVLSKDNQFDVVVSIETFEHLPREKIQNMLEFFKMETKEGGKIIITTPQRHTPEFKYQGGTHLYEYSVNEFVQEIGEVFDDFELYYAVEFRHPASDELNTVFTKNPQYEKQAAVMVAVITNS